MINQVYKGKMLPKDWNSNAGSGKIPLQKSQMGPQRFKTTDKVHSFVKANYSY